MSVSQVIAACGGPLNRGSHLSGDTCHMMPGFVTRSAVDGAYGRVVRAESPPGWGWPGGDPSTARRTPDRPTAFGRPGSLPHGVCYSQRRTVRVHTMCAARAVRAARAPWMAAAALTRDPRGTETTASTRRRRTSAGVMSALVVVLVVVLVLVLLLIGTSVPQAFQKRRHGDIPGRPTAGRPCLAWENGNVPVPVPGLRRVRTLGDATHEPHGHPGARRHSLRVTVPRGAAVHGLLIARCATRVTVGRLVRRGVPDGRHMTYGRMPYGADLAGGDARPVRHVCAYGRLGGPRLRTMSASRRVRGRPDGRRHRHRRRVRRRRLDRRHGLTRHHGDRGQGGQRRQRG